MALILTRTRSIMVLSCILFSMMAPMSQLESGAADYIRCETKETPNYTCWIAWSADGQWIATWSGGMLGIDIWEASTGKHLRNIETSTNLALWYPGLDHSNSLATLSNSDYQIHIWDVETGEEIKSFDFESVLSDEVKSGRLEYFPDYFSSMSWNPSLGQIAFVTQGWVGIWTISSDEFHSLQRNTLLPVLAVAFSPNDEYLALAGSEVELYSWDTEQLFLKLDSHDSYYMNAYSVRLQSLIWSPDGRFLAIDGINISDQTEVVILIYEISTKELVTIKASQNPINALAWSLDGEFIASAGGDNLVGLPIDNAIRIWNTETYDLFQEIEFETSITSIAWNPTASQLAAVDLNGEVYIIDVE